MRRAFQADGVTSWLRSALVCFLAGPSGAYMTGGVIDVSGGLAI
jgi:hypothetical protein